MGAYGNTTCGYCGTTYYEEDAHKCDRGDIEDHVRNLKERIAELVEKNEQLTYEKLKLGLELKKLGAAHGVGPYGKRPVPIGESDG